MKITIRLTIAIPTYNRCKLLLQTLNSIIKQRVDEIEVIVSDNASDDDTEQEMLKYKESHDIKYFRNAQNIGMDGNFLNCLQRARGEYIHLLSDDDILLPGAVEKILALIEEEEPDYINLNSFTYSTEVFDPSKRQSPRIVLQEDLITCDKELYMKYLGVYITYISATIIKRNNFERIKNPQKYYGTYFLHAHLVLDMLSEKNRKVIITKDAYLAAKNNNSGGFNLYEVWIKQYKRLFLTTGVKDGFYDKQMKKIYINDINGFIRDSIMKYRVTENKYDMSNRRILVRYTYMYPSVWVKTWTVAFLPVAFLKVLYNWKRKKFK